MMLSAFVHLGGRRVRVAVSVSLAAAGVVQLKRLSRPGDSVMVTRREYVVTDGGGATSRFDQTVISGMRWQFVPYQGADLTLENNEGSIDVPPSRSADLLFLATGAAFKEAMPGPRPNWGLRTALPPA